MMRCEDHKAPFLPAGPTESFYTYHQREEAPWEGAGLFLSGPDPLWFCRQVTSFLGSASCALAGTILLIPPSFVSVCN